MQVQVLPVSAFLFDQVSKATSNSAVVSASGAEGEIAFSGIQAAAAGVVGMVIVYADSSSDAVTVSVLINQVVTGTVQLMPSNGAYVAATASIGLVAGKNFVTLVEGEEGVRIEE